MKVPVRHKGCGGLVGYYINDIGKDMSRLISKTFQFVNGEHPQPSAMVIFSCDKCHKLINDPQEVERCFEEVVV